jgi:two-component system, chemotaxis family, chemotaxis protein CheY
MAWRVLIVDDSVTTRRVVRRALEMARLPIGEIVEAPNGEAALTRLRSEAFDLVMTDIHMPKMTGTELIACMRADPKLQSVPVIVLTSEGGLGRVGALNRLNVQGYIRKPFRPERVRDMFLDVMGDGEHETEQGIA